MGRIEEIQKRVTQFNAEWVASRGCCDVEDFSEDVQYLLSRIQIAVEALERERKDAMVWDGIGTIARIDKALEQIQKE